MVSLVFDAATVVPETRVLMVSYDVCSTEQSESLFNCSLKPRPSFTTKIVSITCPIDPKDIQTYCLSSDISCALLTDLWNIVAQYLAAKNFTTSTLVHLYECVPLSAVSTPSSTVLISYKHGVYLWKRNTITQTGLLKESDLTDLHLDSAQQTLYALQNHNLTGSHSIIRRFKINSDLLKPLHLLP